MRRALTTVEQREQIQQFGRVEGARRFGNRGLRHPAFAQQNHLNALSPSGFSPPAQRCFQLTDLVPVAFDHLFPPNQMVKPNHTSRRKENSVPSSLPGAALVSIQSAMEAV